MEIGISTGAYFGKNILEVVLPIKESGFQSIEIWAGPQKWGGYTHFNWHREENVRVLAAVLRDIELKVSSLHAPFSDTLDISSPDEIRRQAAVKEVEKTVEILHYLDGKYLVLHPASNELSLKNRNAHFAASRKSIEEIFLRMQGSGVKLALENQLPHILGGEPDTLLSLMEGMPESQVGVCFDTSHANLNPFLSMESFFKRIAGRVKTLHLSDNLGRQDDHLLMGRGTINWVSFVNVLRTCGYDGVFMMEVLAEPLHSDSTQALKTAYQAAKNLLEQFERTNAERSTSSFS